jgi:hypothetical protein
MQKGIVCFPAYCSLQLNYKKEYKVSLSLQLGNKNKKLEHIVNIILQKRPTLTSLPFMAMLH